MNESQRIFNVYIDNVQGAIGGWFNWKWLIPSNEMTKDQIKGFCGQIHGLLIFGQNCWALPKVEIIEIAFSQRQFDWWVAEHFKKSEIASSSVDLKKELLQELGLNNVVSAVPV